MHVVDPSYRTPSDKNLPIWHYRTFDDFRKILEEGTLYFNRVGRTRAGMVEGQVSEKALNKFANEEEIKLFKRFADRHGLSESQKIIQSNHFINCWTSSNNQSDRNWMWTVFTNDAPKNGVVIESTYKCLEKSLDSTDPREVRIGQVQYFDHNDPSTPDAILNRYIYKNLKQEREKEIRAITTFSGNKILPQDLDGLNLISAECKKIKVNLQTLIKKVFISTNHREGLKDDVLTCLRDTIGDSTFAGEM